MTAARPSDVSAQLRLLSACHSYGKLDWSIHGQFFLFSVSIARVKTRTCLVYLVQGCMFCLQI